MAYTFLRVEENVGALREWMPWVAHCLGRLMCLMPVAVTPPAEYLTEFSLPYLRTSADLEYVQATDALQRERWTRRRNTTGRRRTKTPDVWARGRRHGRSRRTSDRTSAPGRIRIGLGGIRRSFWWRETAWR